MLPLFDREILASLRPEPTIDNDLRAFRDKITLSFVGGLRSSTIIISTSTNVRTLRVQCHVVFADYLL